MMNEESGTLRKRITRLALFLADCDLTQVPEHLHDLAERGQQLKRTLIAAAAEQATIDASGDPQSRAARLAARALRIVDEWQATLPKIYVAELPGTRFFQAAVQQPPSPAPPPSWDFRSTMSVLTMLAFCLPHGALAAAISTGLERYIELQAEQDRYENEQLRIGRYQIDDMRRIWLITNEAVSRYLAEAQLDDVLREVATLEHHVVEIDTYGRAGKARRGIDKQYCIDKLSPYLGQYRVDNMLNRLSLATPHSHPPDADLKVKPTFEAYAFQAWLTAANVIVTAHVQYIKILVQPEAAWHADQAWLGRKALDAQSLRASNEAMRVARRLIEYLGQCIGHLATIRNIRANILGRLNHIRIEARSPAFLDEHITEDRRMAQYTSATSQGQDRLRELITAQDRQWVLVDDDFKQESWFSAYYNFRRALTIRWTLGLPDLPPQEALQPVMLAQIGGLGARLVAEYGMHALHVARSDPQTFESAVTKEVPIVEWGKEESVKADALRWTLLVAEKYLDEYNYAINLEDTWLTLGDMASTAQAYWTKALAFYEKLLDGPAARDADARPVGA